MLFMRSVPRAIHYFGPNGKEPVIIASIPMIGKPEILHLPMAQAAPIHLTIPTMDMGKYMDLAITEIIQGTEAQEFHPFGPLFMS